MKDLFCIFGIVHLDHNALWFQRGIRQSKPTAEAVCVSVCWDTSSDSALFVFGLKLQQDLRPRLGMSLLSWVPWDVLPPCSSPAPEEPLEGGWLGAVGSLQWRSCSPPRYPLWPHPDTQPLRSHSIQSEGQRAEEDTQTAWSKSGSTFESALEIWPLLMLFSTQVCVLTINTASAPSANQNSLLISIDKNLYILNNLIQHHLIQSWIK